MAQKGITLNGIPLMKNGVPIYYNQVADEPPPQNCCKCESCADCDPVLDDIGYDPENPASADPLAITVTGAVTGAGFLYRTAGGGSWTYASDESNVALTDGCNEGWTAMAATLSCPLAGGAPTMTADIVGKDVDDDCNIRGPNGSDHVTVEATSWTCDPFSATFEFETIDLGADGDCDCGEGEIVTITVTEP